MTSPISKISSLTIGTVESVAPDEIKVLLDIDSPRNTALNTGVPTPFPRTNGRRRRGSIGWARTPTVGTCSRGCRPVRG